MLPFAGTVWRALPKGVDPLAPVKTPEGRFHHSGQFAIYTSLSAEGTAIAIRRYIRPGDPPRMVVPLMVRAAGIADFRGVPEASIIWQDVRANGDLSPTWTFSDKARDDGAQGLLYSSRSRPDLAHLVLFDPVSVALAGPPQPWPPVAKTL